MRRFLKFLAGFAVLAVFVGGAVTDGGFLAGCFVLFMVAALDLAGDAIRAFGDGDGD